MINLCYTHNHWKFYLKIEYWFLLKESNNSNIIARLNSYCFWIFGVISVTEQLRNHWKRHLIVVTYKTLYWTTEFACKICKQTWYVYTYGMLRTIYNATRVLSFKLEMSLTWSSFLSITAYWYTKDSSARNSINVLIVYISLWLHNQSTNLPPYIENKTHWVKRKTAHYWRLSSLWELPTDYWSLNKLR